MVTNSGLNCTKAGITEVYKQERTGGRFHIHSAITKIESNPIGPTCLILTNSDRL